ncbi:MAG: SRPBCC family protein [Salaquimonas sp.]
MPEKPIEHSLSITRTINAPVRTVWRCWTESELLKQWYCPKPWSVPNAEMEAKAGGRFNLTMAGPRAERMDLVGSFLEVKPLKRLVFTDGYAEGYVPRPDSFMTGVVEFADLGDGRTKMIWSARHATAEARQQHLDMGFEQGWSASAEQLDELARSLK